MGKEELHVINTILISRATSNKVQRSSGQNMAPANNNCLPIVF